MAEWERWLKYGRAKVDDLLRSGHAELDRREAERDAAVVDKPWLRSTTTTPTLEEVQARLAFEREQAGVTDPGRAVAPTSGHGDADVVASAPDPLAIDFAEQQRRADERLAAIRAELGLGPAAAPDDAPSDSGPGDEPAAGGDEGPR